VGTVLDAVAVAAETAVDGAVVVALSPFAQAVPARSRAILGTDLRVFSRFAGVVAACVRLAVFHAVDGVFPRFAGGVAAGVLSAVGLARFRAFAALSPLALAVAARPAAVQRAQDRPFAGVAAAVAALGAVRGAGERAFLPRLAALVFLAVAVAADAAVSLAEVAARQMLAARGFAEAVAAFAFGPCGCGLVRRNLVGPGVNRAGC